MGISQIHKPVKIKATVDVYRVCYIPLYTFSISLKNVPSGYNSLTLKSSNVVSGSFEADLSQDEIILMPKENNTTNLNKSLNVKIETSTDSDNNRNIFLPLPVGIYSNIQVLIDKNGEKKEVLLDWNNKNITLGQVYYASTTYGNSDTPTKVNETLKDILNGASNSEHPIQVNLTNSIVADENPIKVPTATHGKTSDITINFQKAPDTSEETPLKIEQKAEENQVKQSTS